jgi:hypothetical protein
MLHLSTLSNRLKSSIVKSKTLGQFSIFSKSLVIGILTLSFLLGGMQFAKPKIEVKADPITPSCGNNAIVTNPTFNYNGESIIIGSNLYVSDGSKISVIDVTTNTITTTIPVANRIQKFYNINSKLYAVTDGYTYGESIVIINPTNNTIINTVTLPGGSFNQKQIGNKIYIPYYLTGNIQVFDTATDSITSTFNIGGQPTIFAEVGGKLYINDNNGYYIKVLDTSTNTVVANIYGSGTIRSATQVGTKLFLNDESWNAVKVIETSNNTRLADIAIGTTQRNSTKIGNNVYVLAGFNQTNIYIIDGVNATLTSTNFISNGNLNGGSNIRYINGKLFIDFYYNKAIGVVDQTTNTISKYISIPYYPSQSSTTDNKMYVSSGNKVYVVDMTAEELLQPCPVLGSAGSLSGNVGQPAPTIQLYGNTVPNNTLATYTPQGSSVAITGKILNNSFIPDPNQVIPSGTVLGDNIGTLASIGITSIIVPGLFSPPIPPAPVVPLTVTINQSPAQPDPASNLTVKFTAVFSEPIDVSSFDLSDITISGTAPGLSIDYVTQISPNDNTTFEIGVSATSFGTVVVDIPVSQYNYGSSTFATVGIDPHGIAIDQFDNLYTANYTSGTISKILPNGTTSIVGTPGSPLGIAVDTAGNMYTANRGAYQIDKTTPAGVTTAITTGFQYAFNLALDSLGNVYGVSPTVYGVRKITPSGVVTTINTAGNSSIDIVVGSDNSKYVVDQSSDIVTKITPSGYSYTLGTTGDSPQGIAVDTNGNVYTSSWIANNVTKITPSGVSSVLGTTGINPFGIITDLDGNVYTANYGSNNVTKITPAGVSTTIGTTGNNPRDIILDSTGNIYTTNTASNNVTKISKSQFVSGIKTVSGKGNKASTSVDNSITLEVGRTFGSYAGPLTGAIGSSFPTVVLQGSDIPDGTPATLSLSSSTSVIQGTIANGSFIPNAGQVIPSDVVVGNSNGVMSSANVIDLTIDTNFSNPVVTPPPFEPYPAACSNRVIDTAQNYSNDFRTDIRVLGGNKLYIAGSRAGNSSLYEIKIIDVNTNQIVGNIQTPSPVQNLFFINGKLYAAMYNPLTYNSERISVIDPISGLELSSISISQTRSIKSLGSKIFVATSNSIVTIDTSNDAVTNTMGGFVNPEITFATNGKLYIGNQGSTMVVDITSSTIVKTLPFYIYKPFQVNNLLYIPGIKVLDTITDTVVADIPINAYQRDLIVKGDKLFLLGDSYSSKLMTIDLNTNTLVATTDIETGNNANEIIYGGGEIMVIKNSTYDAKLFFIDPLNGSITKTIPMDRQLVTYIAIRNRTYLIEGLGPVVLDTDIRDYQQPCPTLGTANEITGYAGLNFPSIYLNGNNAPNNTPATLSLNGSSQIISGTIIDNQFVPNPNQTIAADATFGNSTGTLSALGYSSIVVPTNLSASPNLGSYIGPLTGNIGDYFPYIFLNGSNVPDGTPASLVLPGSTNMMMGTIQNGYFAVNSYQTIPSDVTIGPATGILSTSITPSLVIPTDFGIETINGSFQAPYPSIINYDDNHDAIVKYEIVFSKNILVSSFTPDDITFGFFQGCNVVLISPYISNFSTNRFEIVLNCGHDLLNDGATIYPQLQAGVVTNGISTNGNFAGRGTTSTLKYTPATLITIDVPVLINSVNQTNFAITGSCVNGFDVNVYVNMTSENLTATCDNSTYFVSPQLIAQCFNDYYGNCNYTATVNQVLSGISDNADGTIGSSDYGILNNQTGGNIYITPQVQINGTNYLYNNTPNLGYFCSDNQNYTLTTSYGNTFSGYCEVNTGNSINIAPNFPNPLPNGPISITGTSTDLFGNTQNISYQGEVCNDPNFSVVTESQSYFNFGTIKASAQNLPSCIPNCNITSNISQYLGSLFSPIIGHAQNTATCSVTVDVPTIINQNNYQNFNITGTCVVGFDVNVIVALTAENLTATCQPDGTYSVIPTLIIVSAYAGCGVNFYNSCSYIATASQNVNGQTTTTSDTGIFDNFVDGQIVGDKTVSIGGINYVYAQPTYYNYNCGDAQSVTLSVDNGQSFTNTCSDSGTFDFLNKIPSTLVNGTINISGNTIDQRGNTKAINYQIEVCLDPSYNNSIPLGFLNLATIKASASPSVAPRPNCTTTISTSSSSQSSSSIASSSINTSSSSSSQSSIEQISSTINSLSSATSSNVSSSSSDSCIIVIPLVPNCSISSSSSSTTQSSNQSSSISTISSTTSSSVSTSESSVNQNSSLASSLSSVSPISSSSAQSSANEDQDNIPANIEDLAPNNGDGNRDGIKDGEQSNVTSLNDPITNRMVTIEINPFVSVSSSSASSSSNSSQSSTQSSSQSSPQPGCDVLNNVSIMNETDNIVEDTYYDYPVGLVNFESSCASKLDVKIYWYGLDPTKNYINRKFKQIGQDYTTYSNINAFVANVNGQDVYIYNYTVYDNSELDEDPRVGYIKDPVGPALVSNNASQSGVVISIGNSPTSSSSSSNQSLVQISKQEVVSNSIIRDIIDIIAPIEDMQIQSETNLEKINTVRTGGTRNFGTLYGILLILAGFGLLISIDFKNKNNNSLLPKNQK